MPKVLYVATVVKTHIMEFHIPYLKMLKEMGWETAVAARNDYDDPADCVIPYCDTYFDIPFERNPFKFGNIKAYKELKTIIDTGNYDVIHCHTPVGAMLTRLAAKDARKKGSKVFYTAHGFHFYKGAPFINWIAYYPVEKWLAKKTDVLITINKEDYSRAQKFQAGSVIYVPGVGVDINRFSKRTGERDQKLKKELGIPLDAIVLLSVGEVNKNKNHRVVIEALKDLPDCWFVLCGRGPLMDEYRSLAESLRVSKRVIMTGYRKDVADFYSMADVFVFPSYREGLPVALMEAMAARLPCVAARNRGTNELLPDSGLFFEPGNAADLVEKIETVLSRRNIDETAKNAEHIRYFDIHNTLEIMKHQYSSIVK